MQVECFTVGAFQVNTYLITDPQTKQSAIVDTGETRELLEALAAREEKPDVRMILLTHGHLDHAGALAWLPEVYAVPTYLPRAERPLFDTLPMQGRMFGMPHLDRACGRVDVDVDDGDEVQHPWPGVWPGMLVRRWRHLGR